MTEQLSPTEIIQKFANENEEACIRIDGSPDKVEIYGLVNEEDENPALLVTLHKLEGYNEDDFVRSLEMILGPFIN